MVGKLAGARFSAKPGARLNQDVLEINRLAYRLMG